VADYDGDRDAQEMLLWVADRMDGKPLDEGDDDEGDGTVRYLSSISIFL